MVKCILCGTEFKQITNWHLKSKHNITYEEYIKKYPNCMVVTNSSRKRPTRYDIDIDLLWKYYINDGLSVKKCADIFKCSTGPIRCALRKHKFPKKDSHGHIIPNEFHKDKLECEYISYDDVIPKYIPRKKIRCELCNKDFRQITHNHLKAIHKINLDTYKKMFPNCLTKLPTITKGIFDDKIGKLKYVKHPNRPKVKCRLCNKEYYRLSSTHMQRKHQIDLQDYKDMFPDDSLFITTDEERKLISKNHADVRGENNSQWLGGLNKNKYVYNWRRIRDLTLEYYGRICYKCGSTHHICVHHINYQKKHNYLGNLIPLCLSCHIKTNWHRDVWYRLFCIGLPTPPLNSGFGEFMDNHIINSSEERMNEIEEELIC